MPVPPDFVPYWQLIAADMRMRIESGQWPGSYKLPSTEQLRRTYQKRFGAKSNTHIRRAIKELVELRLLRTHPGAGVWVIDPQQ